MCYCLFFTIIGSRCEKPCLRGFANNKGTDQPAHPRSLISLSLTWSETPKTGFVASMPNHNDKIQEVRISRRRSRDDRFLVASDIGAYITNADLQTREVSNIFPSPRLPDNSGNVDIIPCLSMV